MYMYSSDLETFHMDYSKHSITLTDCGVLVSIVASDFNCVG